MKLQRIVLPATAALALAFSTAVTAGKGGGGQAGMGGMAGMGGVDAPKAMPKEQVREREVKGVPSGSTHQYRIEGSPDPGAKGGSGGGKAGGGKDPQINPLRE